MAGIWIKLRCRALLREPTDQELKDYIECFRAGYERGMREAESPGWTRDGEQIARDVAKRLGRYRSVLEAGCWLAGFHSGHIDFAHGRVAGEQLLPLRFGQGWDSGLVGDCAWHCASMPLRAGKILAATLRVRPKSIRERVLIRQRLGVLGATSPATRVPMQTATQRQESARQH